MNSIEDLRDTVIADEIISIESMNFSDLVRELILFRVEPIETMNGRELWAFRKKQVENKLKKYGHNE